MKEGLDVPIIFLWINFKFKEDADFLPQFQHTDYYATIESIDYFERLKLEVRLRDEAEKKSPVILVYRSSYLVADKAQEIDEIRKIGVHVIDYDEVIKQKEFYRGNISRYYTAETFKYLDDKIAEKVAPHIRESSNPIGGCRADLIDSIKLELAYNYSILLQTLKLAVNEGCIVQDFDVQLNYQRLANRSEFKPDKILFGLQSIEKRSPENNFIYVPTSRNEFLKKMIDDADKRCCIAERIEYVRELLKHKDLTEMELEECSIWDYFERLVEPSVSRVLEKIYINTRKLKSPKDYLIPTSKENGRVFNLVRTVDAHIGTFPPEYFSSIKSHSTWRTLPSDRLTEADIGESIDEQLEIEKY